MGFNSGFKGLTARSLVPVTVMLSQLPIVNLQNYQPLRRKKTSF